METGPGTFVKITKNVMEGSTANYRFSTYDDYSDLASAIKLRKGVSKPRWSYFLRAESFYNVASALMTKYNDDGKMQDLHARSHGKAFLILSREQTSRDSISWMSPRRLFLRRDS